ncbi:MAG: hypothetical protein R2800_07940 [Flavipsychrobacter sp.]
MADNCTINVSNYSIANVNNGTYRLNISKLDIARGILLNGKTHWSQLIKTPRVTFWGFLANWSNLIIYINDYPELSLSNNFTLLDPQNKTPLSYNIGMGIAKIVSERILKVAYLQHVGDLVKKGIIQITSGSNEQGDLVGLDKNYEWHVVEAKGRSNPITNKDRTQAKRQAQKISSINGATPKSNGYCITYLDIQRNRIELCDPPPPEVSTAITIQEKAYIKEYYDKLFKPTYNQDSYERLIIISLQLEFVLFRISFDKKNLFFGVEKHIYNDLRNGGNNIQEIYNSRQEFFERLNLTSLNDISIGLDGTILLRNEQNKFLRDNKNIRFIQP